jgi:flagellar hook-associated protein 2
MADGILGLGSSGSNGLSQEVIDKLKTAEAKAKVDPYTTKLETWDKELEKITEIESKISELLSAITDFDLYTSGTNVFDQVSANTSGTSASFNALDVKGLEPGSTTVNISQLAQRDVYQTSTFSDKDALIDGGNDSGDKVAITVGTTTVEFSTEGKTYQELADEINANASIVASVEQVGDSEYRIVIKSKDSGEANKLTIDTIGVDLGFGNVTSSSISDFNALLTTGSITINGDEIVSNMASISYDDLINEITNYGGGGIYTATKDGDTIEIKANDGSSVSVTETGTNGLNFQDTSHVVTAQNMKATVDGVNYNVSSNTITLQGNLTMTAVETGISTITIERDNTLILSRLQEFSTAYNELVDLVDAELYADDSPIEDLGSLRIMMNSIKNTLFGSYGTSDDKSIFNYGFSMDMTGYMSIDSTVFSNAITNDLDGLKELFVGVAEKEGLGTTLKSYLDNLDSYDGLLTTYGDTMADRKTKLEEEKTKAQELLDTKYSLMAQQFAAYTAIITQMEAAFGGMKMMIQQSTSGN